MKSPNRFIRCLDRILGRINAANPYLLVLAALSAQYLSFLPAGNEEAYFPLAKQFVDPSWMPHSFVFNEWPGTRILFQLIAGHLLRFLTFEQLAFVGRLAVFTVSAYPLVRFFRLFRFSNVSMLILLQLFLVRPYWVGGEFIFCDFEPKSLAYVFVLFSLPMLARGRYLASVLLAAAASYFHILAGGWYAVFALAYIALYERQIVRPFLLGLLYAALMSPFLYYLSTEIHSTGSVLNGVNLDWVYVFYRNAHHAAPLSRPGAFHRVVAAMVGMVAAAVYLLRLSGKRPDEWTAKLRAMNAVALAMLAAGLLISVLNASGSISKYYLLRIASVGILLFWTCVFWRTRRHHPQLARSPGNALLSLVLRPALAYHAIGNVSPALRPPCPNFLDLVDHVRRNTRPDDVFLEYHDLPISFMRRAERESFVMKKFDPGGGAKIYEWYLRMEAVKAARQNPGQLAELARQFRVDYVVSLQPLANPSLRLAYRNSGFLLYQVAAPPGD